MDASLWIKSWTALPVQPDTSKIPPSQKFSRELGSFFCPTSRNQFVFSKRKKSHSCLYACVVLLVSKWTLEVVLGAVHMIATADCLKLGSTFLVFSPSLGLTLQLGPNKYKIGLEHWSSKNEFDLVGRTLDRVARVDICMWKPNPASVIIAVSAVFIIIVIIVIIIIVIVVVIVIIIINVITQPA